MSCRAETLVSWDSEVRLLRWLGLGQKGRLPVWIGPPARQPCGRPRVVELGCGPGYVAGRLLQDFPDIRVIGVDVDEELLQFAAKETHEFGARAAYVLSRAETCPFADRSVDFVLARYLFQHLEDPLAVAREARRVLTPGGRLVVVDVDADLWGLTDPALPHVTASSPGGRDFSPALNGGRETNLALPRERDSPALSDARGIGVEGSPALRSRPHGGRFVGRRLWKILRDAGFDDVQIDAFVYHSDALGLAPFASRVDERITAAPGALVMLIGLMASGVRAK